MIDRRGIHAFLSSGRAAQAGWGLFLLASLSLALPGLAPYRQSIQTVCTASHCLMGQANPQEAAAAIDSGGSLAEYGSIVFILYVFAAAFLLVTAFILVWRKPVHPAAVCAAFLFVAAAARPFAQAAVLSGDTSPLLAQILRFIQISLLLPTFALMPDGRFRPAGLRWLALAIAPIAALAAFELVSPAFSIAVGTILGIAVTGSLLYRPLVEKQRQEALTWTLVSAALLAAVQWLGQPVQWLPLPHIVIGFIKGMSVSPYPIYGLLLLVGGLTCLSVALLGNELLRVDVTLNRAIVYSFLSLFVISSYVLIVGYLSSVFQSGGSLWFSLIATGVVAALFQPIRERLQRFVNRMIYGERDDPYTVINRLGQRLETVIAPDEVIPTILRTVREALKVSYAAIILTQPEENRQALVAEDGKPTQISMSLPLMVQNEVVGQLKLGLHQGKNDFSTADRLLLEGLARQAGTAIHAARLNTDLQRARERLVIAQEEERRRIRRDLHDGLGASLAALNLQAGEVQRLMASDPETANRRMADLRFGLRTAVGDIRRLVYGLRPPALDELGLLEALRSRIAQYQSVPAVPPGEWNRADDLPVQIRFNAPDQLPQLPAAVEVAVYRIVEEGLANIVHHAQAKNGLIRLVWVEQGVQVEINDDGIGLPEGYQPGVGLHSMRERAAELGGRMTVQSAPGQGTQVCAWLPTNIGEV